MSKTRTVRLRNLTAKAASLILAVAIWFLIKDLLQTRAAQGKPVDEPSILGNAVNPDLQGTGETIEPEKETPTVH